MRMKELKALIMTDAYRYTGKRSRKSVLRLYFKTPGFKYTCKIRFAKFCKTNRYWKILFPLAYLSYRHCMIKYGIGIPYMTTIGEGFYIGHFGGIIVNSNVVIGKNVNLSHGVTIGKGGGDAGCGKGCPIIGDCVYIGPNSTIIGKITIGDNAAIGANAFVNKDVPGGFTVGGVPAKTISQKGSIGYIHNKV